MSFAQQREFDKDSREDIVLNAVSQFTSVSFSDITNNDLNIYPFYIIRVQGLKFQTNSYHIPDDCLYRSKMQTWSYRETLL